MKRILLVFALLSAGLASAQTLEMWTLALSPTFDDYINGVIADFEAEHDGVTVNWIDLPDGGFPDRFFASIAAGTAPDVVNLNTSRMLQAQAQGALVNSSELQPNNSGFTLTICSSRAASGATSTRSRGIKRRPC